MSPTRSGESPHHPAGQQKKLRASIALTILVTRCWPSTQPQRIRARRSIDADRTDNNSLLRRFPFPHQQIPDWIPLLQGVEERDNVLIPPPEGPLKVGDPHATRRHQVAQFSEPVGFMFRLHRFARHGSMLLQHRFTDGARRAQGTRFCPTRPGLVPRRTGPRPGPAARGRRGAGAQGTLRGCGAPTRGGRTSSRTGRGRPPDPPR